MRGVLCFLEPEGATEVVFTGDDLAAAVGEVRALLVSERDHPSAPAPLVPSEA